MARSLQDLTALLDRVYSDLPREWTSKEGAQSFPSYLHYVGAIMRCADDIAGEASVPGLERRLELLDIGMSMGVVACACSAMGMRVTGADDQRNTDHPLLRPIREKFGVAYADYDALLDPLPFEGSSFDVVNSNDMIEHIHGSPKRMLTESHRVLRPGGRISITTPNLASLHNRLLLFLGRSVHASIQDWYHGPQWLRPRFTGHVREYTPRELGYVLREAGFVDVRVRTVNVLLGSPGAPPSDADTLDYSHWFAYLKHAPFYDRRFHARTPRDAAFLLHGLLTAALPRMRRDLVAVARKG